MTLELDKVYDSRTREYLEEVLRSYEVGNYRSVLVLLNSVCLSDIFYKLQELRDVYSDSIATKLLADIESLIEKDKTSPVWEKKLIDSVFKEMHLLDSAGYILLGHLHDYRNLTAHPIMDGSSNLYQPSKELVESCIIEAYNSILIKPAIFVKNIVAFMADDLDSKRRYIADDKVGFRTYIEQKYLIHLSDPMLLKVYSSFWKFTFILTDEACARNRTVNLHLMRLLTGMYRESVSKEIKEHPQNFGLLDSDDTVKAMIIFLANHPFVYEKLSDDAQRLIVKRIDKDPSYRLVSWFLYPDKVTHIQSLIDSSFVYIPSDKSQVMFLNRMFKSDEEKDALFKYYVHLLRNAGSFATVMSLMDDFIAPVVGLMNKERLEELIQCFDENNQVYWNYNHYNYCKLVWVHAKAHFDEDYIKEKYSKFKMPQITADNE